MQLFINKTLLFALIHAKYPNYNLALVKVFNGYPVTLMIHVIVKPLNNGHLNTANFGTILLLYRGCPL